ncbi:tyrosine-protein kinase Src42A [Ciona intestinalis]
MGLCSSLFRCCFLKRYDVSEEDAKENNSFEFNEIEAPTQKQRPSTPIQDRPAPPIPQIEEDIYIALYDYVARTNEDLTFKKGDSMVILNKSENWSIARLLDPNPLYSVTEGYIPTNHVKKQSSVVSQPSWMFDTADRSEAVSLLMQPCNKHGDFLARRRTTNPNEYALSVRNGATVNHIKIEKMGGQGYSIDRHNVFATLNDLVGFYQENMVANDIKLRSPCKQEVMESPQTAGLSHDLADEWEIDRKSIELKNKLGKGNFGEVYEALWNGTTRVAVKKMIKSNLLDKKEFLKEAKILKKLHHPKLVQLYAVCTHSDPFYIVTELMCNGALEGYLREKGKDLNEDTLMEMAIQVATGMVYLEVNNYIHRDLAARNILVGKNNICKIADFGLARVTQDNEIYQAQVGAKYPIKWTAPEAATMKQFTIKSDVWSFGILLTEIIGRGRVPYAGMQNFEILEQVERGYRMPKLEECSEQLYDIMMACWDKDPNRRPSFESLVMQLETCDSAAFLE